MKLALAIILSLILIITLACILGGGIWFILIKITPLFIDLPKICKLLLLLALILMASALIYKYIAYIVKDWLGEDDDVQ